MAETQAHLWPAIGDDPRERRGLHEPRGCLLRRRVAAPMVGGLSLTSFLLELLVYRAACLLWKKRSLDAPTARA